MVAKRITDALRIGIIVASSLTTINARAQCDPPFLLRLLPGDGSAGDLFGRAVGVSGQLTVVGAYEDDENGPQAGSAYLFDALTGEERVKLLASDGRSGDAFGSSVAIHGNVAVIGAPGCDNDSGAVYIFDASTGAEMYKLLPNHREEGERFGSAVAVSGDLLVIGAIAHSSNGPNSGAAYLFDVRSGEQTAKLLSSDGQEGDYFGRSVAISTTRVVVGAYLADVNGSGSGSAYLFDVADPAAPVEVAKLVPSDNAEGDWFGVSAGISGNRAIIGAHLHDENLADSGVAYLFDTLSGEEVGKLRATDGAAYDMFGWTVAIDNELAVVGAFGRDERGSNSGAVYVFDVSSGQQLEKLLAPDSNEYDYFGYAVGINQSIAVVGALYDDNSGRNSGSAYVFDTQDHRLALWQRGSCSETVHLRVTGATPGAQGAIVVAFGRGNFQVPPNQPCSGTILCLDESVRVVSYGSADQSGFATIRHRVDPKYCGRIHLQAIDFSTCATSNVILIE